MPEQIILDLDATNDPAHRHQEGRFLWLLRQLLLPAALHLQRTAPAGGQAAAFEHRRRGRVGRGSGHQLRLWFASGRCPHLRAAPYHSRYPVRRRHLRHHPPGPLQDRRSGARCPELPVDAIERIPGRRIADCGPDRLAPHDAVQAHHPHQHRLEQRPATLHTAPGLVGQPLCGFSEGCRLTAPKLLPVQQPDLEVSRNSSP